MKRHLAVVMAAVLLLFTAACSGNEAASNQTEPATPSAPEAPAASGGDINMDAAPGDLT